MEDVAKVEVEEDVRQSIEYGLYMEKMGWKVIRLKDGNEKTQLFVRKIGPTAVAKLQRSNHPVRWKELEATLKMHRVVMCKIEPPSGDTKDYRDNGFKVDTWPLLGTKTLRIDLRPNVEVIFNNFKKDCRYVLRRVQDEKLKVQNNEFERFYEIWKMSAKRKDLWIPGKVEYGKLIESFGTNCYCVTIEGAGVAGCLVLIHKNTAFYYYAGADLLGNRSDMPYLVVWEAIKEAKKKGCKVWDFEGIYDGRWPNKRWKGFTHFKKSFGGVEVEYPGCFSKWRWPF